MQDKELLFEVVQGDHLQKDIQKLRKLANVAGLLVGLEIKEGATFLSIRYSDEFTEFIRNRNAGKPRKSETRSITCGEVFSIKKAEGAKVAAIALNMSLSTFYRHCLENTGKGKEEMFL